MQLNLKRPLVVFDLETTGLNIATDRIVQLSYIKVMPNGDEKQATLLINPEMHIPEASSNIHHITDDVVKDAPTFKEVAQRLAKEWEGCDLAGFNSNKFDVPLLVEEMLRAKVDFDIENRRLVDVMNIFRKKERRNLVAAYRFYCDKDLEGAHSADADTRATYEVLMAQLDRYPDLQNNIEYLEEFSRQDNYADVAGNLVYDDKKRPCFNFGKYKGMLVTEVFSKDPAYYSWMMDGQFAQSTKRYITRIKLQMLAGK